MKGAQSNIKLANEVLTRAAKRQKKKHVSATLQYKF
jgi:hypothetical protein